MKARIPNGKRFPGLELSAADRRALKKMATGRSRLSARLWKRIRILELLDDKWHLEATARAVGTYPREVRRVGWRYLEGGLEAALGDAPRPKPSKMLDTKQQAAIVAMVCGPPPAGTARWTVVLVAKEAQRRGIVAKVSRETTRRLLASHELKPWREKNVVCSKARPRVHRADGGGVGHPDETSQ